MKLRPLFLIALFLFIAPELFAAVDSECPWLFYSRLEKPLYATIEAHNLASRFPSPSVLKKGDLTFPFQMGIGVVATRDFRVTELAKILTAAESEDPTHLKNALDAWLAKYTDGIKTAFSADIERVGDELAGRGLLKKKASTWVDPGTGYIDETVYALLLKEKLLPITDPHHLLSHLVALLDPDYVQGFRRQVALVYTAERASRSGGISTAGREVYSHLQGYLRDWTIENWSVIVRGPDGKFAIHGQGNRPVQSYLALKRGDPIGFAKNLLGTEFTDPRGALMSLPRLKEFITEPKNLEAFIRYRSALMRFTESRMRDGEKKLVELAKRLIKDQAHPTSEEIRTIFAESAQWIASDANVAWTFSTHGRMELLQSSDAFYERYTAWVL